MNILEYLGKKYKLIKFGEVAAIVDFEKLLPFHNLFTNHHQI